MLKRNIAFHEQKVKHKKNREGNHLHMGKLFSISNNNLLIYVNVNLVAILVKPFNTTTINVFYQLYHYNVAVIQITICHDRVSTEMCQFELTHTLQIGLVNI